MRQLALVLISGGVLLTPAMAISEVETNRSISANACPQLVGPMPAQTFVAAAFRQPLLNVPTLIWSNLYVLIPADELWLAAVALSGPSQIDDFTSVVVTLGRNLALDVHGQVQLQRAVIAFGDGTTQVLDFPDLKLNSGVYRLLGSDNLRVVQTVRLTVRGVSTGATIRVGVQP